MEPIIRDLDIETALAMLAEAIEDKGSCHTYRNTNDVHGPSGCVYVLGTEIAVEDYDEWGDAIGVEVTTDYMEPGCIIGNALVGRGVPMEKFVELGINSDTPVDSALSTLKDANLIGDVRDGVVDILRVAQTAQDEGASWGSAYIKARAEADMYDWSDDGDS